MKKIFVLLLLAVVAILAVLYLGRTARAKKAYHLNRANHWFDSGQFDKAEAEYLDVLRTDPQNTLAIGRLGVIYFDEGRFQTAAPFLLRGSQLDATNTDLRLKLGQIYLAVGDLKNARNQAELVLEQTPQDPEAPVLFAQSAATTNDLAAAQQRLTALARHGDTAALQTGLGVLATEEHDFRAALLHFQRALAMNSHFASAYAALGTAYLDQNQVRNAESAFKAAADCAPLRSPLQFQYGQIEIQAAHFALAENFFSNLTKKAPDYVPYWLGLADVALAEKKLADCSAALGKALARDPQNVEALVLDARLDLARSDVAKATAKLERLSKLYPEAPRVHYQLALAYVVGNQIDKALNQAHEAVGLDPAYLQASFLLAQLELQTGDTGSAVALLKQLIARQPDLIEAQILLANAYRLQGDFNDAQDIFQQLEKSFPQNAQFPLLAGLTFAQQLNDPAARRELYRSLDIEPGNVPAQEALAQLDLADGRFSDAQERIEKIISRYPRQAQPQILLAKIFLAQNQTNQAEAALLKAAGLPEGSSACLLLAQLYFDQKQDQKALNLLNLTLQDNPKSVPVLMLAALVQSDQKNYQAATDTYEKLLAIAPQYSPALNNLAWLYCDHLGQLEKAYDLAERARQLLPADPSTADTLGWVLFKKGQYLSALKLFQESAAGLPDNPEVLFHVGIAQYMLADEDAARQAFQNALALNKDFPERTECENCLIFLNIDPATADVGARASLELRISEAPDDPVAFARLVRIYQRDNHPEKTMALCETALKANPQNVRAMVLLAQLSASSNPQKAYALAQAAYQLKPDDTEVCATLGRLAYQNGNDQWAYTLLEGVSQNQPGDAPILFDLANAAFSVGKFSDSQTAMQSALQAGLPPAQSAQARNFLDMLKLCQDPGQAVTAQSQIENILDSNPDCAPALFADAIVESQNQNPLGAERSYESLLARHPDCAPAQKNLVLLYAQNLVDPDKAYPVALKARQAFPDDPQVARAFALVLFERGDYSQAADLFSSISDSADADAQLFYCLGISEFHLKNFSDSRKSLQHALNLNLSGPEATDARETLAELK